MMNTPSIGIIISTTREKRFGPVPAEWILRIGRKRPDLQFEIVDLKDFNLPMFDEANPHRNARPATPLCSAGFNEFSN